jgi:hypothetical protein
MLKEKALKNMKKKKTLRNEAFGIEEAFIAVS